VNLRVPGPTPCPAEVLQAGARQMINHRGPEFAELINTVHSRLQEVFSTQADIAILTCSGTGGLEAAIINTLSPGDRVLCISIGVFGDRLSQVAEVYGADVIHLRFPLGEAADPDKIKQALQDDSSIKAVAVTHNETSTGVTNDLQQIASMVRSFDKLLIVDAISSLGCIPVEVDAWGCDVVVTGSQKGFMVPPGLAFVSVSDRGWNASKVSLMPRFYLDLEKHVVARRRGQTPWTPAVSVLFGLEESLKQMLSEGMQAIHQRHKAIATRVRNGVLSLGLELFARDQTYASDTVTAVKIPENVKAGDLLGTLRSQHGVILAGGQGPDMEGKIFRIGHLGFVDSSDVEGVITALDATLAGLRT
jgi:aspartate aminotransferase-like enzyme